MIATAPGQTTLRSRPEVSRNNVGSGAAGVPRSGVRAVVWILLTLMFHACGREVRAQSQRLPDDRPKLDAAELQACGLNVLESRRLLLVTDLPLETVKDLPLVADALFEELERQVGTLAPDRKKNEFQVTGYLIEAKERFEKAGVLPPAQFQFRHGRNLGYQFWMNNQASPYYRRHLLLHEFVHCFMMCEHGMNDIPPLWYTEGLAEYFATHELADDVTKTRFGILPASREQFEGWGRISQIRRVWSGLPQNIDDPPPDLSLEALRHPNDKTFVSELKYAESWALVWLIRNHPELREHFKAFPFVRTHQQFSEAEKSVPPEVWSRLNLLWPLFLESVIEGFEPAHALPTLNPKNETWAGSRTQTSVVPVSADKSWQTSGWIFGPGQKITLTSTGRYAVHDRPRPWISEPPGITIDYHAGRPLGEVTAIVLPTRGSSLPQRISMGDSGQITFTEESELWLQVNDSAASRADNNGVVEVRLQHAE